MKFKIIFIFLFLQIMFAASHQPLAGALSGNLKQQIMPLNCVYQTVNDGTGTVIYLTPTECGVLAEPTIDNSDNPATIPGQPTVVTIVDSGPIIFQIPFIETGAQQNSDFNLNNPNPITSKQPFANLTEIKNTGSSAILATSQNSSPRNIPAPVAIMVVSVIILLLLLILL